MSETTFQSPHPKTLPIEGEKLRYPVKRIFYVGRNYEAHAAEMGNVVDREAPFYFTKSTTHVCSSGKTLSFPKGTSKLHHEVEFVIALGSDLEEASHEQARDAIFGYACGLDMTRRDLQGIAKETRRPWDIAKDFENSGIFGPITPAEKFGAIANQRIWLTVNDELRQESHLNEMVHNAEEILCHLSTLYHLEAGDLVMTGTPSGVGPVHPGDKIRGSVDGLEEVVITYKPYPA